MSTSSLLEADRAELARFVETTFRHAHEGTAAVLRTFAEGSDEVPVRMPLNGAGLEPIIDRAARQAIAAGNAARPTAFAAPVASLADSRTRERDLDQRSESPRP